MSLLILAGCSDQLPMEPRLDTPRAPGSTVANLQATPPGYIRIGVVPSATSILIGADDAWTLRDKATGAVLLSGAGDAAEVTLLVNGETRTRGWLQVTCTSNAAEVNTLVSRASAAGFETLTETPSCTRVLFGTISAARPEAERNAFEAQLAAAGLPSTGWWRTITQVIGETEVKVSRGTDERVVTNPVVLQAADGIVRIAGSTYRGVAEVWMNSSGTLAGVNELPIEEYLYGVVPRELPPVPYGLLEAQKAQAVAARTYALSNLGKHRINGYDLTATTSDQVYGGLNAEHPVSTQAVDATAGIVATYEGDLVVTFYHSTSGGYTANHEDVYNPQPKDILAYLRGVPDTNRGQAHENVPSLEVFKRAPNSVSLRSFRGNDYEAHWSRYHRWNVDWTVEEMAEVLAASLGQPITTVMDVRVVDRADLGRVRTIEFETDAGTFEAHKDAIRWTLRYLDVDRNHASLRSTLFYIEPVLDPSTKAVTGWKAYGGGWGHGLGMSQTGAVGMAEKGKSYDEILKHYYQGIELETRQY